MSYHAARSLGATVADKTPDAAPDLVRTWSAIKDRMRDQLGELVLADGGLNTFLGQRCPMATVTIANTTFEWLVRLGGKMIAAANAAGRNTGSMSSALSTFKSAMTSWRRTAANSFGGRLPLETSYRWIDLTDRYIIAMSAAQWAAFNNGTKIEMWTDALHETPGGDALLGIWEGAKTIGGGALWALENLSTVLKVGAIVLVGYVGYSAYRKAQ